MNHDADRGSYARRTTPHAVRPEGQEQFFKRVEFERFVLGMTPEESTPVQVGAPPAPPSEAPEFSSWLRAAKFWRDVRRKYGNGAGV